MRSIWITKWGGPEVLEVRETPTPEPGPGEVRVVAAACGLNFAEITARMGLYPDAPKAPLVVGYEGAGHVDAVGSGVSGVKEGDRVLYLSQFKGHASHVVVPEGQVSRIPDAMSFEQAAALPVNYVTAYHMLFEVARVRSGDSVLIHAAAGGVGTAVLQLCGTIGGITTYGTASGSKHEYVRGQGCDHPIDYRSEDYAERVRALTNGRGVDYVFDALGGADWTKGYELLRPGGMLVAFGLANVSSPGKRKITRVLKQLLSIKRYSPLKLMDQNRAVAGVNLGHLWDEQELLGRELEALVALFEAGKIAPHIHATYPFSKAADAYAELEFGKNVGKVLLIPD